VQMPRGVPVATVAINNATNAGLLAARILGAHIPRYCPWHTVCLGRLTASPCVRACGSVLQKVAEYQKKSEREVHGKVDRLAKDGWAAYQP
jgi:phosphoribosylaminoimidazole carboxylase